MHTSSLLRFISVSYSSVCGYPSLQGTTYFYKELTTTYNNIEKRWNLRSQVVFELPTAYHQDNNSLFFHCFLSFFLSLSLPSIYQFIYPFMHIGIFCLLHLFSSCNPQVVNMSRPSMFPSGRIICKTLKYLRYLPIHPIKSVHYLPTKPVGTY